MWFAWKYKVAYDYALEPLRKPPDPRRVYRAAKKFDPKWVFKAAG